MTCVQCGEKLVARCPSEFWCGPDCHERWQAEQAGIDRHDAVKPTGRIGHGWGVALGLDGPGAWWLGRSGLTDPPRVAGERTAR